MRPQKVIASMIALAVISLKQVSASDTVINMDFLSFSDNTSHSGADGIFSTTGTYWNGRYPYNSYHPNRLDEFTNTTAIGIGLSSLSTTFTSAIPNTLQDSGYVGYFQCWLGPLNDNATYDLAIYFSGANASGWVISGANITNYFSTSASEPTGTLPGTAGRDYVIITNLTEWVGFDRLNIVIPASSFNNQFIAGLQLREHLPPNQSPTNIVLSSTNVAENMPVSTTVGSFSTQDTDAGNTFTYTLVAGTGGGDNGSFTISGSNLLTAASFNYEVKSNFSIRVQSTDQGGLSTQKIFAINVSNVNETPTNILLSSTNVAENLSVGTTVGAFSTQDPDFNNTFTYTLVSGSGSTDNGSFTISGSNLLTAAIFNYEVKSNYSIRVQSADQGGLSTQKVSAINIVDVNEPPPSFLEAPSLAGSNMVIRWGSITNKKYTVRFSTNLLSGFSVLQGNIPGTPAVNSYTDTLTTVTQKYWKVTTDQ